MLVRLAALMFGALATVPGTGTLFSPRPMHLTADSGSVTNTPVRIAPVTRAVLYAPDKQVALCVAACFEGVASYTTPAYVSMDVARAVTLVYRSAHAMPLVTFMVDAFDSSPEPPSYMTILVKTAYGALITQTNEQRESWYQAGGGAQRLAVQFDPWRTSLGAPTGAYDYQVIVRSRWPDNMVSEAAPLAMRALVVDERASPYGAGWTLAGVQRIYRQFDGSILLTEGDGTVRYFQRRCAPQTCYTRPAGDFSTLIYASASSDWTRRYPDGTTARFNSAGQMTAVTDRLGNATTYEYLAGGRLASITDPAGKRITFAYDGSGKLRSIQDPGGRVTSVAIDPSGDLTGITDATGATAFRATYTVNHLLSTWTNVAGNTWELRYDFAGRIESMLAPTVVADGAPRRPTIALRSLESAMLYGPSDGTPAQPRPRTSSDSLETLARVTGPRGFTTSFALGRFGAPLLIVEPRARRTRISYDDEGRVVRTQSPSGHVVRQTYEGPDLVERWDSTAGRRAVLQYEPQYHQLARISGDVTPVWNYWSNGRLDSTRTGRATDSVTKFTYDARNRVETITDPAGHTTRIGYFASGPLNTSFTQVTGMTQSGYQYDDLGRLVSRGYDGVFRGVTQYDALNRTRLVVGVLGDTTRYGYGPAGLDTITDANGQRYVYRRNALGWIESEVDAAGRTMTYRYDAGGNVVEMVNRRGQNMRFTYDALDLLTTRTADGETATYSLDSLGVFAASANAESTDTMAADVVGRKIRELSVRNGITYELSTGYDAQGRRSRVSAVRPWSATVTYHYDEASRLDELTDLSGRRTTFAYDADRLELHRTLPNGVRIATGGYFSAHMPRELDFPLRGDLTSEFGASYFPDARGQLGDRIRSDSTGNEYQHDAGGRLMSITPYWFEHTTYFCQRDDDPDCMPDVEVRKVYGTPTSLQYDLVGNPRGSGVVIESGNRLRRLGEYQADYDADGNMTRKYRVAPSGNLVWDQTLSWNSLGQLTSVTTNGSTVSFGYDGWGRRVRKSGPSGTVRYLWDGDDLFAELDASGNRVTEYTYYPGIDHPHSMRRGGGGQLYYYVSERPGHVVALLDASGIVVGHYEYSAFGEPTVATGAVPNALRFAARERDAETGLYYNRARYYDPTLRRFVSEDPIGLSGGINQYAYIENAPLDGRDPSGLCRVEELIIEQGPDGTWKSRCPPGAEYMQLRVPSEERDYFEELNRYLDALRERSDAFARYVAQERKAALALSDRLQGGIGVAASITWLEMSQRFADAFRAIGSSWQSSMSCSVAIQQHIAASVSEGAAVGAGGQAARNYMSRAPVSQGVGTAAAAGAATGAAIAAHNAAEACK